MPLPRITIVTPSYNQAQFLEETIQSVLSQDYASLEYIIIDGGSTDGSVDIIREYADRLTFWVSEPDSGQSDALLKGFSRCSGDLLGWINSDDVLLPGSLDRFARAHLARPDAGLLTGNTRIVAATGSEGEFCLEKVVAPPVTDPVEGLGEVRLGDLYPMNRIGQPSTLFTREAFMQVGQLDRSLHYSMDYELWVKTLKAGFSCVCINAELSEFRVHGHSKTGAHAANFVLDDFAVAWRHFPDEFRLHHAIRLANSVSARIGLRNAFKLLPVISEMIAVHPVLAPEVSAIGSFFRHEVCLNLARRYLVAAVRGAANLSPGSLMRNSGLAAISLAAIGSCRPWVTRRL